MANNIIDRSGAEALIPEEQVKEIIQGAVQQSTVLSRFKRLPNMASKTQSVPVLNLLPNAYFEDGDTTFAKLTDLQWKKKKLVASPLKVIVAIPNDVLDDMEDAGYDFDGEVMPRVEEAIGRAIDAAVIWGINKPDSWRTPLVQTAITAGNVVYSTGDTYGDIMGEDGVFAKVEEDGFECNGAIAGIKMKSTLRGLRDDNGQPIFKRDMQNGTQYSLDGNAISFSSNGTWDNTTAKMVVGDFSQAVFAFRKDMTVKLLTEGVIQDPSTREIVYNLGQQGMSALMITLRAAWELPNPINAENENEATRLPFAVLAPATIATGYTVTVTVTDSEGTALDGATVDLAGAKDITGEDGVATFENITDGAYKTFVTLDGYRTKKTTVTVSGEAVSVTVQLKAKTTTATEATD